MCAVSAPSLGAARVAPLHFLARVVPDPVCMEGGVGRVLVCAVRPGVGDALGGFCVVSVPEFL